MLSVLLIGHAAREIVSIAMTESILHSDRSETHDLHTQDLSSSGVIELRVRTERQR